MLIINVLALPEPIMDLTQKLNFKIISFNVRVDTHSRFFHEKIWNKRFPEFTTMLYEESRNLPTVIGFQELKHHQVENIMDTLNKLETLANSGNQWSYYGIGRDNGKKKGEYAPIFYQSNKWQLLNSTTKWLSETPDEPSKFWNAACKRIVTFATLENVETGVKINVLNTHYDHRSQDARGMSSKLVVDWIKQIPNDHQTFLSGDFNSISSDLSYQTLIKLLADTRVSTKVRNSHLNTYTGFEPSDVHTVIDFVWCTKDVNGKLSPVRINNYNVIDTWTAQGFRFSDHRPVLVEFSTV